MRCMTLQSREMVSRLFNDGEYSKSGPTPIGFDPIFVIPMEDPVEFLSRLVWVCPMVPQRAIIFDAEEVISISYLDWCHYLEDSSHSVEQNPKGRFVEHVVPRIKSSSVIETIKISNTKPGILNVNDIEILQDEYLDWERSLKMYQILAKYFGPNPPHLLRFEDMSRHVQEQMVVLCKLSLPAFCVETQVKDKDLFTYMEYIKVTMLGR